MYFLHSEKRRISFLGFVYAKNYLEVFIFILSTSIFCEWHCQSWSNLFTFFKVLNKNHLLL